MIIIILGDNIYPFKLPTKYFNLNLFPKQSLVRIENDYLFA